MKRKPSLVCLLWLLAAPLVAHAELKLPQSQDDFRELAMPADSGPCTSQCGVVSDVRSASRQPGSTPSAAASSVSGIGSNVATTPIIGSGSSVKNARKTGQPVTYYKVTVRYDNGSYALFEQDDEPTVRKGDPVEVVEGRVVPRQSK